MHHFEIIPPKVATSAFLQHLGLFDNSRQKIVHFRYEKKGKCKKVVISCSGNSVSEVVVNFPNNPSTNPNQPYQGAWVREKSCI